MAHCNAMQCNACRSRRILCAEFTERRPIQCKPPCGLAVSSQTDWPGRAASLSDINRILHIKLRADKRSCVPLIISCMSFAHSDTAGVTVAGRFGRRATRCATCMRPLTVRIPALTSATSLRCTRNRYTRFCARRREARRCDLYSGLWQRWRDCSSHSECVRSRSARPSSSCMR